VYPKFATTSNVKRFLASVATVEQRGAGEASWLIALGRPGLGKTRTLMWWATQHRAVYLRAKSNWRPHWMLSELVTELGEAPERRVADLEDQAMRALALSKRPVVIDEARNMLHDGRLLETIRDLTDMTELLFVLGGEDFVLKRIAARFPQIDSRITSVASFERASLEDVRICCDVLSEVAVADDLVAEIHRQSQGYYREIKNAIAYVETFGKRHKGRAVTLADMTGQQLCRGRHEGRARKPGEER
jgi:DNA transposition AAA+ family ATPase